MSSIITINSGNSVINTETLTTKIQEKLYMVNKISEEIIEEISKIRELSNPQDGILTKALTEAAESSKALKTKMDNATTEK